MAVFLVAGFFASCLAVLLALRIFLAMGVPAIFVRNALRESETGDGSVCGPLMCAGRICPTWIRRTLAQQVPSQNVLCPSVSRRSQSTSIDKASALSKFCGEPAGWLANAGIRSLWSP